MRLIVAFVLACAVAPASAQTPAGLVGTWQLASRVDRDSDGKAVEEPSLGMDPLGYLIYDSAGHVAVQLMAKHRGSDPCQVTAPSVANNLTQVSGYEAYFGHYEVDGTAGTVTHIIEGALSPSDVGRRLTRRFKLEEDTLTIQFEPGGQDDRRITRTIVWRRVTRSGRAA